MWILPRTNPNCVIKNQEEKKKTRLVAFKLFIYIFFFCFFLLSLPKQKFIRNEPNAQVLLYPRSKQSLSNHLQAGKEVLAE